MTEQQAQTVRALVQEKRYDEARAYLLGLPDDADARQWLRTLDDYVAHAAPEARNSARLWGLHTNQWTAILVIGAVMFIVTRNVLPGILFALYTWRFNTARRIDVNRILVGVILSLGLYYFFRDAFQPILRYVILR